MDSATIAATLAPWIGADVPHGKVVRVWANDAANAAVSRFAVNPDHTDNGQLSLKAATGSPLSKVALPARGKPDKVSFDPKWPTKPLKADQISTAPPETGVIIINLKGLSMKNGIGLSLQRMGPDKDTFPAALDHAPDQLNFLVGLMAAKKDANFLAMAVPPGRWRIGSMGASPVLGFCLGSPAFEVAAGDIIFAGTFDLGADDMGPDLSLDPVKAWLGDQPANASVKPASYVNGTEGLCGYNGIYALEIKGAPFEPDYHWGSAIAAPAPAASAEADTQTAPAPSN